MIDRTDGTGPRSALPALGAYLHVPFCSSSCDFCGFYQIQSDRKGVLSYIEGARREAELLHLDGRRAETFFWGGGTPGLLPAKDMVAVAEALFATFGRPAREWTVEMAPSSVKADKLEALRALGVTRISMGVQSLDERALDALGRQHSRKQVLQAYELVRSFDFPSVNLDLIFAIPGQTEAEWRADLRETLALAPDHISTYCLTFEEDTALYVKLQQGKVSRDPDREARFYRATWEETAAAGFAQYEISNYARPGHECIHNVNTWRMHEWVGIGPSAASQFGGERGANVPDLGRWLAGVGEGRRAELDRVALSPQLLLEDALIFGLRMNEGVDLAELEARLGAAAPAEVRATLDRLCDEGRAEARAGRIRLTDDGRLVADAIGAELLGAVA